MGAREAKAVGEEAAPRRAVAVTVLKSDLFGRVERVVGPGWDLVRRVPAGRALSPVGAIARLLLRRERRALIALAGLDGVPQLVEEPPPGAALPGALVRSFSAGLPLSEADALPEDFFWHLEQLAMAMHTRGVCHNDLHKEQNVLVEPGGRPALIDFQLASVHRRRSRSFASRVREDLRHVEKHRQRYLRRGRSRAEVGLGPLPPRGLLSRTWRAFGKPVYVFVTRRVLRWRDGEPRRDEAGPWPRWDPPLGGSP